MDRTSLAHPAPQPTRELRAIVKAKTGVCEDCGKRFRHGELVEVTDSLTYFQGDKLCRSCWHSSDAKVL